jgi:hypothetical protein
MEYLCAICQRPYHPRFPTEWFCNSCWHRFKEDIVNNAEWVVYCRTWEAYRRRLESHTYMEDGEIKRAQIVRLGDKFDISESGKLVKVKFEED